MYSTIRSSKYDTPKPLVPPANIKDILFGCELGHIKKPYDPRIDYYERLNAPVNSDADQILRCHSNKLWKEDLLGYHPYGPISKKPLETDTEEVKRQKLRRIFELGFAVELLRNDPLRDRYDYDRKRFLADPDYWWSCNHEWHCWEEDWFKEFSKTERFDLDKTSKPIVWLDNPGLESNQMHKRLETKPIKRFRRNLFLAWFLGPDEREFTNRPDKPIQERFQKPKWEILQDNITTRKHICRPGETYYEHLYYSDPLFEWPAKLEAHRPPGDSARQMALTLLERKSLIAELTAHEESLCYEAIPSRERFEDESLDTYKYYTDPDFIWPQKITSANKEGQLVTVDNSLPPLGESARTIFLRNRDRKHKLSRNLEIWADQDVEVLRALLTQKSHEYNYSISKEELENSLADIQASPFYTSNRNGDIVAQSDDSKSMASIRYLLSDPKLRKVSLSISEDISTMINEGPNRGPYSRNNSRAVPLRRKSLAHGLVDLKGKKPMRTSDPLLQLSPKPPSILEPPAYSAPETSPILPPKPAPTSDISSAKNGASKKPLHSRDLNGLTKHPKKIVFPSDKENHGNIADLQKVNGDSKNGY